MLDPRFRFHDPVPRPAPRSRFRGRRAREEGIALLVVMVVFVVLYLVVYQLHFSTSMEEKIARMRYGEVEAGTAMHSMALFYLSYLIEDLKQGSQAGGATDTTSSGTPRPVGSPPEGGDEAAKAEGGDPFTPLANSATGGAGGWYDYETEALFQPMVKQVGETSVKATVTDNESKLPLNMLFEIARLKDEEIAEGLQDIREEDLVSAVSGKSEEDAAQSLREKIQERSRARQARKKGAERRGAAAGGAETAGETGIGEVGDAETGEEGAETASESLSEYEPEEEFVPPTEEQIQATQILVERTLSQMFSINENAYGYRYSVRYSASEIAAAIVQYVLERRRQPYQNRIYLVSELLNIPEVTPEIYYGPWPLVVEGEDVPAGDGFLLKKDEFGDIIPEYQYGMDPELLAEEKRQIQELERDYGRFMDFSGFGLSSAQANPMTRGMAELPIAYDENDEPYVVERPIAIGLKDIFTTFSTGKININTASVPVLFGLLLSLSEEEANLVALDIRDYRNRQREEAAAEGVDRVGNEKSAPDLGQPRRSSRKGKDKDAAGAGTAAGTAEGTAAGATIDPLTGEPLEDETAPEMNYFTTLDQLELIDGTEGDARDQMRRDEGVERVSEETDTLFRRVVHDLEKVAVFGSTYFTVEFKARPQKGRSLKKGAVTLRRDTKKRRVEVLMWKNLEA